MALERIIAEAKLRREAGQHANAQELMRLASLFEQADASAREGRADQAVAVYLSADAPWSVEAQFHTGDALRKLGRLTDAIERLNRAMALCPTDARIVNSLAMAFMQTGMIERAIDLFRKVVDLRPADATGYNNLASAMGIAGRSLEVIPILRKALELRPDYASGHHNLGNVLKDCGDVAGAIACYEKAIELESNYVPTHSNRLFALNFVAGLDDGAIDVEHRRWARQYADHVWDRKRPHNNDRSLRRRLRVGYVSPDFREHVVGGNLRSLFRHHDRERYEIFCYSGVRNPDGVTEELRRSAHVWRDVIALSDAQLAELIPQDAIDILVDLSVHTDGNRLLAFAAKPAPVQITYLGYCGTTGLAAMDYRLSDPHFDPPGNESPYVEQTLRLQKTYWCYQPGGPTPDPTPPSSVRNGFITFGCLNNFAKASDEALKLWAKLLQSNPKSRFIIHAPAGPPDSLVSERFSRAGLPSDRVQCIPRTGWAQYIALYHEIDIALDPFPFGGGITTCDALWMGVPVVTLRGRTAVGRGGASILSNVGMRELIAEDEANYLRIANELAGDAGALARLRASLRDRLTRSPLMAGKSFAHDVESAYRQAWNEWIREPAR